MLRLINILILFIASAATAAASTATAGDFGCRWMSHPAPDDTSHVWFRHTLVIDEQDMPRTAYIHVATTGRFVLYVNGRNVSTALFTPDRTPNDTTVMAISYDVRRFLRPDSNTIALLPFNTHTPTSERQLLRHRCRQFTLRNERYRRLALSTCRHLADARRRRSNEPQHLPLSLDRHRSAVSTVAGSRANLNTSTSHHLNTTTPQHNTTSTPQHHTIST